MAIEYVIILLITLFGISGVPGAPLTLDLIPFLIVVPFIYFAGTEVLKLLIIKKFQQFITFM